MTSLREAAQAALEAYSGGPNWRAFADAMDALKAALAEEALQRLTDVQQEIEATLAEPAQEPVAWLWPHQLNELQEWKHTGSIRAWSGRDYKPNGVIPVYTAPPQRKPLTDAEISNLWSWSMTAEAERTATTQQHAFARAIERAAIKALRGKK